MRAILAIAGRELRGSVFSPVGACIIAGFLALTGSIYFILGPQLNGIGFVQGQPATLTFFFNTSLWLLLIAAPAISMRLISEELRLGTLEVLLCAPINERQIIMGKFLGAFIFLVVLLLPTAAFVVAIEVHGRPDYGEIFAGYLGLLLIGSAVIASGLLASTVTASQVMAFLLTLFGWIGAVIAAIGLPRVGALAATRLRTVEATADEASPAATESVTVSADVAPDSVGTIGTWLLEAATWVGRAAELTNPIGRVRTVLNGLIDSYSIAFFVLLTAFFLVAASRMLAFRRTS